MSNGIYRSTLDSRAAVVRTLMCVIMPWLKRAIGFESPLMNRNKFMLWLRQGFFDGGNGWINNLVGQRSITALFQSLKRLL